MTMMKQKESRIKNRATNLLYLLTCDAISKDICILFAIVAKLHTQKN